MTPGLLLTALRSATHPLHQRLEQQLNVLSPEFSLTDYRRLLLGFLGYYRPLERHLSALPDMERWLPDSGRRFNKTALLEQDLVNLGVAQTLLDTLPECKNLPDCGNRSQVFGCLYVIEGSTLGGQVMNRHLQATLGLGAADGTAFFSGYGAETGALWKILLRCLDDPALDQTATVQTAVETFISLENWLLQAR